METTTKPSEDLSNSSIVVCDWANSSAAECNSLQGTPFQEPAARETFAEFIARNVRELLSVRFAALTFVENSLRRRYHNSILGFAWSFLNPLLTMGVMVLIFSLVLQFDAKRFAVYLFSNMLPWTYMVESLVGGTSALIMFEGFLNKVYLPKNFFPLVVVSISTANFAFNLFSLLSIAFALGMTPSLSLLLLPLAVLVTFVFNLALAVILSIATLCLRDLTHIVTVGMSVIFYAIPILYPVEKIPKEYHFIFEWNPFYHFLNLFKTLIYEARIPAYSEWLIPVTISGVAAIIAMAYLKANEKEIIYRL